MADRYWVGGTGTWSSTNTANWSTSSGGAGGASVPTAADNVIFDAGSDAGGIFTVTMANSPRVCNDFTASGLDFTMTLAGTSIGLTVSGSLSFPATNFTRTYTGTTTFNATTTGKTITTNGVAFGASVTLDGVGGEWTLGSAFSCGTSILTLINGTFDTSVSNYAVTAGAFSSNNSNVRTINLNGTTITLSSLSAWTMTTSTNATLNAGTSTIDLQNTAPQFTGGGLTYYNVSFTSTALASNVPLPLITGANTFNNLTITGRTTVGIGVLSLSANQTINGTFTVSAGTAAAYRIQISSNAFPTIRTLTCAAVSFTDTDFRDITIAGAASPATGTRLGDCKGNSGITFDAAKTVYYGQTGSADWGATGSGSWSATSGGSLDATQFPLAQDTAVFPAATYPASGSTTTINANYNIGTIDMSLRTSNTMTLATGTTFPLIFGNWINGTGITLSGTATITFIGRTTQQITSSAKTFTQPITINSPSGSVILQDALTTGTGVTTTLFNGTLDLNNLTHSTGRFLSSNTNTRSIAFGTTGSIVTTTTTAAAKVLEMTTATNFTFTGTSNISAAMSVTRTFEFGTTGATASNRLNINLTSGASVPTFTGSFRQINFTGSTSNPGNQNISCHGFTLASGGTYTSTDFTTVGDGTLTSNGKVIDILTVNGSGITTTLQDALTTATNTSTLTCNLTLGTLDLNGFTLTTSILNSSNSNTRSIAFGTTGSIVLSAASGRTNLSMADATNFTFTGTSNISAAMSVTRTFSFGATAGATASNRLNINLTSGGQFPTFTGGSSFRQINFTGSTCNPSGQGIQCHGFTLASGGTYTSTTFIIVGTGTLTYTGRAIDVLDISTTGITTTLADAGQNNTTALRNGTLDLAGFTLTSTASAVTVTGTKNLTFNGGTLVCSAASATAWNNAQPTGFTTTAGTGTGTISMTAATAKTFVGGGSTYNCTLNQGGAGDLTITGSNTFNDITNTVQPASVLFTAGTTSTFSNFSLSGTAGNLITIGSVTAASHTLSKASGTVSVSFCSISQSNATGGATWEALTTNGNVNGGNNTGWFFGFAVYDVFITEAASGIDSVIGRAAFSSALADTATATDSGVGFILFPALVADTATATDSVLSLAVFSSALAETATATDSVISFADFYAALAETATTTDSILSFADFYAALTETATATDSPLVAPSTFNAPVAETATATDAVSPPGSIYNAPVSETVTISDLVLGAYLWNLIDDSQSVTWQNVNSSPGTVWSPIDTDPDTGWSVIPTVN